MKKNNKDEKRIINAKVSKNYICVSLRDLFVKNVLE